MKEKKTCFMCEEEVEEYYWENIVKDFCSLECTNEYLEMEGFNPISNPNESSQVKDEYK
jgi:hypothetical protein